MSASAPQVNAGLWPHIKLHFIILTVLKFECFSDMQKTQQEIIPLHSYNWS